MNKLKSMFLSAGATLILSAGMVSAQPQQFGGGNFDPQQFQQQMQQRMLEAARDQLEVTNDQEWKIIDTRLTKVMQLRTETMLSGGLGMFAGMGRNRGGGGGDGGDRGGRAASFMRNLMPPNPEADAVQKALDDNAPAAEINARLAKLREAKKQKQAALAKAQADLRQVLSVRQEATLVMMGFLE